MDSNHATAYIVAESARGNAAFVGDASVPGLRRLATASNQNAPFQEAPLYPLSSREAAPIAVHAGLEGWLDDALKVLAEIDSRTSE